VTKLLLSGYFGFGNLGDDAILYSMVNRIRAQRKDCEITVLSNCPKDTTQELGVTAVNRWNLKDVISAIRGSDVFISGGGSLLQDITGVKSLLYYLGLIWLAEKLNKKVMIFAQGLGPLTGKTSRSQTAKILRKVDVITVRDKDSAELLNSIGVTKQVTITADPVLALANENRQFLSHETKILSEFKLDSEKLIVVCPRTWKDNAFLDPLAEALSVLLSDGYQVCLVPFHVPGDLVFCQTIAASIGQDVVIIDRQVDLKEVAALFSQAELVIGMRLHSLIIAAALGTPMVGISYDPKVEAFLRTVEQPCAGNAQQVTAGALIRTVGEVLNAPSSFSGRLEKNMALLSSQVDSNYQLLYELIEKM